MIEKSDENEGGNYKKCQKSNERLEKGSPYNDNFYTFMFFKGSDEIFHISNKTVCIINSEKNKGTLISIDCNPASDFGQDLIEFVPPIKKFKFYE